MTPPEAKISKKTDVQIVLSSATLIALISVAWSARGALDNMDKRISFNEYHISQLSSRMETATKYRFTSKDMERWSRQLEQINTGIKSPAVSHSDD